MPDNLPVSACCLPSLSLRVRRSYAAGHSDHNSKPCSCPPPASGKRAGYLPRPPHSVLRSVSTSGLVLDLTILALDHVILAARAFGSSTIGRPSAVAAS